MYVHNADVYILILLSDFRTNKRMCILLRVTSTDFGIVYFIIETKMLIFEVCPLITIGKLI